MTSHVITIGIKVSGSCPSSNLRRQKGNHILTFVIELYATCICLIYVSILIVVTVLCYI